MYCYKLSVKQQRDSKIFKNYCKELTNPSSFLMVIAINPNTPCGLKNEDQIIVPNVQFFKHSH